MSVSSFGDLLGERVDLVLTDGTVWGRGRVIGYFSAPSYVVDIDDGGQGYARTGWSASLTREVTADPTADVRQPATEPHRMNAAEELTDQQRRDFFGDHPLWAPFRELHARIADGGCACTDDESCRDHDLLDRKIGAQIEKQVSAAGDLLRAAEDALDRAIGREHVRVEQIAAAVQAYRAARSTS